MSEFSFEDILAEYADGFIRGTLRAEELFAKYDIQPGSELAALLDLAQTIGKTLIEVQPSPDFVEQLRHELMTDGNLQYMLARLRHLTNRQILAGLGGLTVMAGVFWWVRRSNGEGPQNMAGTEGAVALAS